MTPNTTNRPTLLHYRWHFLTNQTRRFFRKSGKCHNAVRNWSKLRWTKAFFYKHSQFSGHAASLKARSWRCSTVVSSNLYNSMTLTATCFTAFEVTEAGISWKSMCNLLSVVNSKLGHIFQRPTYSTKTPESAVLPTTISVEGLARTGPLKTAVWTVGRATWLTWMLLCSVLRALLGLVHWKLQSERWAGLPDWRGCSYVQCWAPCSDWSAENCRVTSGQGRPTWPTCDQWAGETYLTDVHAPIFSFLDSHPRRGPQIDFTHFMPTQGVALWIYAHLFKLNLQTIFLLLIVCVYLHWVLRSKHW